MIHTPHFQENEIFGACGTYMEEKCIWDFAGET
jgi:hypothetical protein